MILILATMRSSPSFASTIFTTALLVSAAFAVVEGIAGSCPYIAIVKILSPRRGKKRIARITSPFHVAKWTRLSAGAPKTPRGTRGLGLLASLALKLVGYGSK